MGNVPQRIAWNSGVDPDKGVDTVMLFLSLTLWDRLCFFSIFMISQHMMHKSWDYWGICTVGGGCPIYSITIKTTDIVLNVKIIIRYVLYRLNGDIIVVISKRFGQNCQRKKKQHNLSFNPKCLCPLCSLMHAVGFGFSSKLLAAGDSFELLCGAFTWLCITKRFNCVNEEQVLTGAISTLQFDANVQNQA